MSAVGTSALHYFSVMQKPIAGGLLLSRARFLFGFWWQSYKKMTANACLPKGNANFASRLPVYGLFQTLSDDVTFISSPNKICKHKPSTD